jgi:hypothetical protein
MKALRRKTQHLEEDRKRHAEEFEKAMKQEEFWKQDREKIARAVNQRRLEDGRRKLEDDLLLSISKPRYLRMFLCSTAPKPTHSVRNTTFEILIDLSMPSSARENPQFPHARIPIPHTMAVGTTSIYTDHEEHLRMMPTVQTDSTMDPLRLRTQQRATSYEHYPQTIERAQTHRD